MSAETCPCGSGTAYSACCGPLIEGVRPAATPEELMRSRYSAYVKVETGYIFETTHPAHRGDYDHEGTKKWAEEAVWEGLEIISATGGPDDRRGKVEFVARYVEKDQQRVHHELGEFEKKDEKWYFTEGRTPSRKPVTVVKVGRNDPCTCGSGAKYKKCCGK